MTWKQINFMLLTEDQDWQRQHAHRGSRSRIRNFDAPINCHELCNPFECDEKIMAMTMDSFTEVEPSTTICVKVAAGQKLEGLTVPQQKDKGNR